MKHLAASPSPAVPCSGIFDRFRPTGADFGRRMGSGMAIVCWLLIAAAGGGLCSASAAERADFAGCAPGSEVPTFYMREVAGARPNLAICLVCRYGSRPVVMVCVRRLDSRVEELLQRVDRQVDSHRGVGLRGLAIFVSGDPRELQPRLATIGRQRAMSLPLGFPVEAGGPRTLQLPDEAPVTVLLYRNRTIQERFIFDGDELTEENIRQVEEAAMKLLHDRG